MKTEQEQIEQMITIFKNNREVCHHTSCIKCKYCDDKDCMYSSCAHSLYQAGYGDVSEYKAEIERLEQQNAIQCDAWQKLSDENERLVTENNSNLRHNSVLRKENKKLKEEIKQAQLGVLGKLWSNISNSKQLIQSHIADGSFTIEDIYMEIDELMAEVQNAEDKG